MIFNKAGTLVHLLICRAGRIKSGLVEFSRFNHHFCHELIQKVYSRKNTDRFVPFKVSWSFLGLILDQESEQKIRLGYTSFIKELQKSKNLLLQKKLKELILQREFGKGFDFHLRNAGLDFKEVQIISNAMMKATKHGTLNLQVLQPQLQSRNNRSRSRVVG